jgi:hypothetical protein
LNDIAAKGNHNLQKTPDLWKINGNTIRRKTIIESNPAKNAGTKNGENYDEKIIPKTIL